MVLFLLFFVFVLGLAIGALTILGAEAVGVYVIINRLNHKNRQKEAQIASQPQDLDPHQSLDFASNKQVHISLLLFISFLICFASLLRKNKE